MALALLGAVAGGLFSSRAASKASRSQERSANKQIAYSEETRDLVRSDLQPYRESGALAQNALMSEYGLGEAPEGYGGFQESPGYQYAMQEGQRQIDGSAAARGNLFSGSTLRSLQANGQGLANQQYGNWLNGLQGLAGSGQNAAAASGTALTNNAQMVNNALGSIGNAQSAGYIGSANALNAGIGNAIGAYQYGQQLNKGGQKQGNSLFGSWG